MKIPIKITRATNAAHYGCQVDDIVYEELEIYIAAVVASEISNAGLEACKAQAIAARSFAISRGVLEGKTISDSSSEAQAFRADRYNQLAYPNCIAGAKQTAGQVLMYQGKVISAVYSASNGGRTISSEERWGGKRAYLIAQDDPWDAAVSKKKEGHGVGMSQAGCKYAAAHGISHEEILAFYYPHTEIKQVIDMKINERAQMVVDTARSCMGYPYVFAAWGEECTPANRRRRVREDHPQIVTRCQVLSNKASNCDGCKYKGSRIFDCRGFTYWCLKQAGIVLNGQGATSQYKDKTNWIAQGPIAEMPNVVCCLFKKNGEKMKHTGLHIGDGKIIHCSVEVSNDTVNNKTWTHYAIPKGLYSATELDYAEVLNIMPTLKKGSKGEDVKVLQEKLQKLGFYTGEIDGKFGTGTASAEKDFQALHNLQVDGVVGQETWKKILAAEAEAEPETVRPQEEENEEDEGIDVQLLDMITQIAQLRTDLNTIAAEINDLIARLGQIKKGET